MAKRSRRRQATSRGGVTGRGDARERAGADLIALMLDALPGAVGDIAGPAVAGGVDIEPLLVALLAGVLDDHLERIASIVNARLDALHLAEELIAANRLYVGQRIRIGHNVRPLYLHGRSGAIIARKNDAWLVQLDEPVGRYTTGEITVRSTQIEPEA